jgi:hypothetical protein
MYQKRKLRMMEWFVNDGLEVGGGIVVYCFNTFGSWIVYLKEI